jgi:DnaJ-class molecular chaperone
MIPELVSVDVAVAPGTKRGALIFLEGQGGRSEPGGSRGNLFVYVLFRE